MHVAKYCASGNDFIIFHTLKSGERGELAKALCDRNRGIGADGLIVLVPHEGCDFAWEFYNSDGSRANMCGNGARAAALYAKDFALAGSKMRFLTGAGEISACITHDIVEIKLTSATIKARDIYELGLNWWLINTGVPHLVAFGELDSLSTQQLRILREKFDANVNFAQERDDKIMLRTFERGVEGETLACGTGMAAVFMRAKLEGLKSVKIDPAPKESAPLNQESALSAQATLIPASKEELRLRLEKDEIFFSGRVEKVCEALLSSRLKEIELDALSTLL